MEKELNKILWDNVDIKGDRPMKKEVQKDLENFINQKLQQAEQRKVEEIIKLIQSKQGKVKDGTEFNEGVEAGYRYLIKELTTN